MATTANKTEFAQILSDQMLLQGLTTKEVSEKIGSTNSKFLDMVCRGDAKLKIDRLEQLANALNCDFETLARPGFRQFFSDDVLQQIGRAFGERQLSTNEQEWLDKIRNSSNGSVPPLTPMTRKMLHAIVGAAEVKANAIPVKGDAKRK